MSVAPVGARVLVVDDEPHMARLVTALLGDGYRVDAAPSGDVALGMLEVEAYDVVLTDLMMPGMTGVELLRRAHRREPDPPFVVLTAQPTVESAVEAMRAGAFDYLRKGAGGDELRAVVDRAVAHGGMAREVRRLRSEVDRTRGASIIGSSVRLRALLERTARVAESDASVLILGESGTGKELLARALHRQSPRKDAAFVAFDCSALAAPLLESELFGHEKGAFTGAERARRGLFREAQGGTLFLDEIGDIAPEVQSKLLRVLQEREVKPVGGDQVVKVDVRLLAATNKDLKALVARGAFREDLYYRLAVVPLEIPPLRARREDIPALVAHFMGRKAGVRRPTRISPEALAALAAHDWPGNVRELENVIELASILAPGDEIRAADLPHLDGRRSSGAAGTATGTGTELGGRTLKQVVDETVKMVERQAIEDALRREDGSATRAARALGLSRATFYNKLKALGIKT